MSLIATASGEQVHVHTTPDDPDQRVSLANPLPSGGPLVLLAVGEPQDGWVHVRLPIRPNGQTGWVRQNEVSLSTTTYRLTIDLSEHRLVAFDGSRVILDVPVGIGTGDTPTPVGEFFITELLRPPRPDGPYGPYAYGLSGFSNTLESFAGGDAVVGIHGTNDPSGIGRDVSHGCIRLANDGISTLVGLLPLGTPVTISD